MSGVPLLDQGEAGPGIRVRGRVQSTAAKTCQMMSSAPVDAAVTELFLAAVTPAQVDVALHALDAFEAEQAEARRQRQMQIGAGGVRGRDRAAAVRGDRPGEPAGGGRAGGPVGAGPAGARAAEAGGGGVGAASRPARSGAAERRRIREMATDLAKVWHAATTGMADRKELLRFLVHRVYLDGVTEPGQIRIDGGVAHGGADDGDGAAAGGRGLGPEDAGCGRGAHPGAAADADYEEIAAKLNAEGFRTAKGLRVRLLFGGLHRPKPRLRSGRQGRNSGPMCNPCAL